MPRRPAHAMSNRNLSGVELPVWRLGVTETCEPMTSAGKKRLVPYWMRVRESASVLSLVHTSSKYRSAPYYTRPPPEAQDWMSTSGYLARMRSITL